MSDLMTLERKVRSPEPPESTSSGFEVDEDAFEVLPFRYADTGRVTGDVLDDSLMKRIGSLLQDTTSGFSIEDRELTQEGDVSAEDPRTSTPQALQDLHNRLDLSWDELAKLFGVSRRTVHYWVSGSRMAAHNQQRLESLVFRTRDLNRDHLMAPREGGLSLYSRWVDEASGRPQERPYRLTDLLGYSEETGDIETMEEVGRRPVSETDRDV